MNQVALQVVLSGFINKKSKGYMLPLCCQNSSVETTISAINSFGCLEVGTITSKFKEAILLVARSSKHKLSAHRFRKYGNATLL